MNTLLNLAALICLAWAAAARRGLRTALLSALALGSSLVAAQTAETTAASAPDLVMQVRQLILEKFSAPGGPRVEIELGQLDPRLKLAPCQKVQPYVPANSRLWGPSRIGLRCVQGSTPWNVYLPVTVSVFGPGVVAVADLPAGHVLQAADLRKTEVKLSDQRSGVWTDSEQILGRSLAYAVGAGQALRQNALKPRQWFAAGDLVQIRAVGGGFAVAGSGEALSAGMEGISVKIRTQSGKIVSGMPVGERQMEMSL